MTVKKKKEFHTVLINFQQVNNIIFDKNNTGEKKDFFFKGVVYVKSIRELKNLFFLDVNDGTVIYSVQAVFKKSLLLEKQVKELKNLNNFSIIFLDGKVKINTANQSFEIIVNNFKLIKQAKLNPIQKKTLSLDYLRTFPEYRIFTRTFYAIFKVRSALFQLINQFLDQEQFLYINSPIVTNNDSEGSGEVFEIHTKIDQNFFQDQGFLTVSGQLHIEPFAMAFDKVYIFSPCFRSEKSNTSKHLSEFWMLELEVKNKKMDDMIYLVEKMINFLADNILKKCYRELLYLNENIDKELIDKIKKWKTTKIHFLTYSDAVNKINEYAKTNDKSLILNWGEDLGAVHEKFLTSTLFNNEFVAVLQFPKEIKPFYMKNDVNNNTIYNCFDVLAPLVGELVGGSEREDDYGLLLKNIDQSKNKLNRSRIDWYLKLRHYAYHNLVGFGLGFDRLVMLFTSQKNIKDVVSYPRFYNSFLK